MDCQCGTGTGLQAARLLYLADEGGIPVNTCFPTDTSTSWAENHVAITGIFGIGREKIYSLCRELGSQFMIDEWEYHAIGVAICDCPSGGHDMIFLDYSLQQRAELIIAECMKSRGTNPYEIFNSIARKDFVRIHGPEHHVLDGACILTAFHNAGGRIDLNAALHKLMHEGLRMPGAACGLWGVCGAVTSIGAAFAIIDGTGPLSTEDWGSHMEYTSAALARLAKTGGPRCCKRDAFASMEQAVGYIKKRYGITLDMLPAKCDFSSNNAQCIGKRCPYTA